MAGTQRGSHRALVLGEQPAAAGVLLLAIVIVLGGAGPVSAAAPAVHTEVPVTATYLTHQRSQNSPMLAVDPTEPRFVALANRVDGPTEFDCQLELSGDAGSSWVPARPIEELPIGVEHCYAPEIAFDKVGRLYYLFVGLAGGGNTPVGAYLTSSTDRGHTFSRPQQVLGPRKYGVRMAIDADMGSRGRIHLVWLAPSSDPSTGALPTPPNPILTAHSDDGGATFSAPVEVSDPGRELVVAPSLALGPHHSVDVAYYDLGDDRRDYQGLEGPTWEGRWAIVTTSSHDGGAHFDTGVVAVGDVVPPQRVMLIFTMPPPTLVAGTDGHLHVGWWDNRNGDWDVFVSSTGPKGSWSDAVRLNDDPVGNGHDQYMPQLSVAPGGRLDAIFYDRRDDADNTLNHVYYTYSTDGGQHFAANRRVTSEGFFSGTGSRYPLPAARGLVEFGGRIALISHQSGV